MNQGKQAMDYVYDFQAECEEEPNNIVFEITKRCNLKCTHCYNPEVNEKELSTDEICSILRKIPNPQSKNLGLTGGEALTRKDFAIILECIKEIKFRSVNIDTNGTLWTKEKAVEIYESGIHSIQVSIDGTEEAHDWVRGKGSYKKLIENIPLILNAGIAIMANITVHKKNINEIFPVWEGMGKVGVQTLKIEPFLPMGRGKDIQELALNKEDVEQVCEIIKNIEQQDNQPKLIIDNLFKSYLYNKPMLGCPSSRTFCIITHKGKMVHCPVCVHFANDKDDVIKNDFVEVWKNSDLLNKIRNLDNFTECKGCEYLSQCGGGCHVRAYAATGSLLKKDPMCKFSKFK